MAFRAAFQKGSETLGGKFIKWWDNGPYSHCELVFSDGTWGSSTGHAGVALRKRIVTDSDWDYLDLPAELESSARKWFEDHRGKSYDYVGLFRFVLDFLRPSRDKWFCSRACADALGMTDGWREGPNGLYADLKNAMVI